MLYNLWCRKRSLLVEKIDLNTVILKKKLSIIYIGQLDKSNKSEIFKIIKDKNNKTNDLIKDNFYIKSFIGNTKLLLIVKVIYIKVIVTANLNYCE